MSSASDSSHSRFQPDSSPPRKRKALPRPDDSDRKTARLAKREKPLYTLAEDLLLIEQHLALQRLRQSSSAVNRSAHFGAVSARLRRRVASISKRIDKLFSLGDAVVALAFFWARRFPDLCAKRRIIITARPSETKIAFLDSPIAKIPAEESRFSSLLLQALVLQDPDSLLRLQPQPPDDTGEFPHLTELANQVLKDKLAGAGKSLNGSVVHLSSQSEARGSFSRSEARGPTRSPCSTPDKARQSQPSVRPKLESSPFKPFACGASQTSQPAEEPKAKLEHRAARRPTVMIRHAVTEHELVLLEYVVARLCSQLGFPRQKLLDLLGLSF